MSMENKVKSDESGNVLLKKLMTRKGSVVREIRS